MLWIISLQCEHKSALRAIRLEQNSSVHCVLVPPSNTVVRDGDCGYGFGPWRMECTWSRCKMFFQKQDWQIDSFVRRPGVSILLLRHGKCHSAALFAKLDGTRLIHSVCNASSLLRFQFRDERLPALSCGGWACLCFCTAALLMRNSELCYCWLRTLAVFDLNTRLRYANHCWKILGVH